MKRARILHVSTVHPPYDQRIFEKEARGLAIEGFRVDVAMTVRQPTSAESVTIRPLGSFGGSRFRRIARNLRALRYMLGGYDIIHVHDPELLIAGAIARLCGKRVVYDVHELHHTIFGREATTAFWVPSTIRGLIGTAYGAMERLALPHFAGVVISMPDMAAIYQPLVPANRIALVRNFPQFTSTAFVAARNKPPPMKQPYLIQTGGASYLRGFHVLVAAAETLRERGITMPIVILDTVTINMYPPDEQHALLRRAREANVHLLGRLAYHEMLQWVAHAYAGIASYLYYETAARCFSTKIFEYFAFGLPVVVSDFGINAELVRSHEAGLLVSPEDPASYADAIERLVSEPELYSKLSSAAAEAASSYSFEADFPNLVTLYERILAA